MLVLHPLALQPGVGASEADAQHSAMAPFPDKMPREVKTARRWDGQSPAATSGLTGPPPRI